MSGPLVNVLARLMRISDLKDEDWPDKDTIPAPAAEIEPEGASDQLLLEEALLVYAQQDARLDRIDNRATTLQGTVGIAAALVFAAGGVILDEKRVPAEWQVRFAVPLAACLVLFLASGYLAAKASLTRSNRAFPTSGGGQSRMEVEPGVYRRSQAVDLLDQASSNARIAWRRLVLLQAARRMYEGALLALLATVAMFMWYVLG
jgi:hypothetical protein